MFESSDTLFITLTEEGKRLDKILADRFQEHYSRTYFQYLIEQQMVLLNGQPVKKRVKLQAGDEVEICFILLPQADLTPEAIPLDILFEDDHLLVINKPIDMVVHPAPGNWSGTFVNALLHHCKNQKIDFIPEDIRPGIVHRLDKETSGVMVAAKNSLTHQRLVQMFADRQVHKQYLAVCYGAPTQKVIDAPIARHPIKRKSMAVVPEGKEAVTRCEVVTVRDKISVVRLFPETGRTHQIRVHLRHVHAPILGDALYGNAQINKKYKAERQLLHAEQIQFCHPLTGASMEISAPVPADMEKYL